ncbi:phage terminase large subunit [Paracraurococcus lichenis]|uniref:Phage terminase large subunit n=1 Tax=Paracraurococcus lichenis TaxID=3064888 RepID=A0ABT9E834_9PROT|nr:phage terminase large subunit [Paracraurococcus sp. LOR1-02]MDO9712367.1 phage terminase large subunit [Paracraurococcus sp. LOR1-02]
MELARRRAARTDLLAFTGYTNPSYRPGAMHRRIAEALERVERGECRRLLIFAPPRHGKSELVSRRFPAWALGRNPHRQFISASYGQDLASDFGRDVRNLVASAEFAALFPGVGLAEDSGSKARWHTNQGGSYVAAGVGTAITGRGADILSIDDPTKDRADAESPVVREGVWSWFTSTAFTRLMPNGAVIVTQTRWHADDLSGRLLDQMAAGGERWEVLNLPALDDAGEALWPERYSAEALAGIREAIGPRDWAALYLQSPVVAEGAVFDVDAIKVCDIPPAPGRGTWIRAWDLAATAAPNGRSPDWTAGLLLHQAPDNRLTVCDIVRLRAGPEGVERAIVETAKRDGGGVLISLPVDPGAAGKTVAEYFVRQLLGYTVQTSRETGSKTTRAMPIASQANGGNLAIVRAPWNRAFLEELRAFPNGQHDDQADALSRAFAEMAVPTFDASYSWVG